VADVRRRALLGGALALGAAPALGGCSKKKIVLPRPAPDVAVLTGAIRSEQALVALYGAVLSAHPDLATRLNPMLAHHREHLTVLRHYYIPATGEKTPSPTPTPAPRLTAPAGRPEALAAIRDAERQAAADRTADCPRITAGVAQIFAAIGACEAGHAALLGWTGA
jgi:hypothetical protein